MKIYLINHVIDSIQSSPLKNVHSTADYIMRLWIGVFAMAKVVELSGSAYPIHSFLMLR